MNSKLFYQEPHIYHNEVGRVSKTALDRLDLSPAHYQAWLHRKEDKPTPALIFGGAYHCKALEHHLYPSLYAVIPNDAPSKRSKDGKTWWDAFNHANEGKIYLKEEDEDKIQAMVQALKSHSRVKALFNGALIEYSCYSTLFGVHVKCKPDLLRPDLGVVVDLKSANSAKPHDFSKACADFRYHVQASFYMDQLGDKYRDFLFIVQEKTEPYAISIYRASEEMLTLGRLEYADNLLLYKECVKNNHWPGYEEQISYIDLPYWYVKRKEGE